MSVTACLNCSHETGHNLFGKCRTPACSCASYVPDPKAGPPGPDIDPLVGMTYVLRNPATNTPVAVPDEIIAEEDRPYRAHLLHLGGISWDEIAKLEFWPDGATAAAAVQRYLNEGRAVWADWRRAEGIATEVARLDALQAAVWRPAIAGNIPAVHEALGIIWKRIKLLRFDEREPGDTTDGEPMPTTVVIGSTHYARELQVLVEGAQPARYNYTWAEDPMPYQGDDDMVWPPLTPKETQ